MPPYIAGRPDRIRQASPLLLAKKRRCDRAYGLFLRSRPAILCNEMPSHSPKKGAKVVVAGVRRGFGLELDPLYCDVSLRHLQSVCGLQAVLEATGQRFEEVAAQRQEEPAPAAA